MKGPPERLQELTVVVVFSLPGTKNLQSYRQPDLSPFGEDGRAGVAREVAAGNIWVHLLTMLVTRRNPLGSVLLALCVFGPILSAQATEDPRTAAATEAPEEPGAEPPNPSYCDFTFHIPWSGHVCSPPAPGPLLASQEDMDHLKTFLTDNGEVLKALHEEALREAGRSRFQDIVSEALPDVREANEAFYESLEKFLQELEDHAQADHAPHAEDEKKRLKEHLRMMDHMLRVTGHLAEEVEQVSQNLLASLANENPPALSLGAPLGPS